MFLVSFLPSKPSALLLPNYSCTFLPFQNKDHKDECVSVTPQILIQKHRLLTIKPMQTTCTAHQTVLLSNH